MSRAQTRKEMKQLREQLNTANRATDARLLKLALVMAILAFVAALVYGKITL